MTYNLGAELTALSAPGFGFRPWYRPYYGYGYPRAYLGAEPPQRTGLTAELAPIVAPATGGVTVEKCLDDNQVLHVKICVDGKCYEASMNLAPAIAMVMQKLASWHAGMHAPKPPPETVVSTVETAVGMAEDALVGEMVGRHVDAMTSGWLSDIGNAIGGTIRKLQPVISTVATGVATAYGGPAAGAAASKLVPMWTGLQANLLDPKGDPAKKAAAQQKIQQINQQAQSDPQLAAALSAAHQAVKNTAVAYHVKDTAQKAAKGDQAARQQIAQVATDAERGDPAAKAVADLVANAMESEWGAKLWEKATGRGPSTISGVEIFQKPSWNPVRKALLDDVFSFLQTIREQIMQPSASDPNTFVMKPTTSAETRAWWETKATPFFRRISDWYRSDDTAHLPGWLNYFIELRQQASVFGLFVPPINQAFQYNSAAVKGWVDIATVGQWQEIVGASPGGWVDIATVGQWQEIVGAALEDVRDIARTHASTKRGKAAGVIQYADGTMHGRGFGSLERAMEWLKHATRNRTVFIYAAACDKAPDGSAQIHDEEIGEATPRAVTPNAPVAMVG